MDEGALEVRRTIAMNVTELRIACGWSQAELARRSTVRETEVADVEAGIGEMLIDTLSLLAEGVERLPVPKSNGLYALTSAIGLDYNLGP
jgi:transcriptional regulator with XRE-family HTH domain